MKRCYTRVCFLSFLKIIIVCFSANIVHKYNYQAVFKLFTIFNRKTLNSTKKMQELKLVKYLILIEQIGTSIWTIFRNQEGQSEINLSQKLVLIIHKDLMHTFSFLDQFSLIELLVLGIHLRKMKIARH